MTPKVEMKWTKAPKEQLEVGLNQPISLECDADGSPKPTIEWHKQAADGAGGNGE